MILTRDGKEVIAIYKRDGSEVDEVKDANGRLVYTNTREITGTLPLSFTSRGKPLSDYRISGNAVQDGTPTPEAPVDVVGCGVWDEIRQSYKLPITVNGTESPIYLGEAQTTRKIKKVVLTGEETYYFSHSGVRKYSWYLYPEDIGTIEYTAFYCSHGATVTQVENYVYGTVYCDNTINLGIFPSTFNSQSDVRGWLAAQYSAGTPVTIWCVLAEQETGIVNEPLMKIGNYADTITMEQAGVTIPTVSGTNVLDMSSPVKPSEVYIKGKGIRAIT
jgi:hypothetical protein